MLEILATVLVTGAAMYVALGAVFAAFFVWRGVQAVDPAAARGTWGFRLLIFPGTVALWPLLLARYRRRSPPPEERNAHRDLARGSVAAGDGP